MISDILSDAVESIKDYREREPEVGEYIVDWIEDVIRRMDNLRRFLDS